MVSMACDGYSRSVAPYPEAGHTPFFEEPARYNGELAELVRTQISGLKKLTGMPRSLKSVSARSLSGERANTAAGPQIGEGLPSCATAAWCQEPTPEHFAIRAKTISLGDTGPLPLAPDRGTQARCERHHQLPGAEPQPRGNRGQLGVAEWLNRAIQFPTTLRRCRLATFGRRM
jgi:hypothetical protein